MSADFQTIGGTKQACSGSYSYCSANTWSASGVLTTLFSSKKPTSYPMTQAPLAIVSQAGPSTLRASPAHPPGSLRPYPRGHKPFSSLPKPASHRSVRAMQLYLSPRTFRLRYTTSTSPQGIIVIHIKAPSSPPRSSCSQLTIPLPRGTLTSSKTSTIHPAPEPNITSRTDSLGPGASTRPPIISANFTSHQPPTTATQLTQKQPPLPGSTGYTLASRKWTMRSTSPTPT
jgi:hypothetical protein